MKDTEIKVNSETGEVIENENVTAAKQAAKEAVEYTKAFENEVAKLTDKSSSKYRLKYTLDYALEKLEDVQAEALKFSVETGEKISQIRSGGPGDIGTEAVANALQALINQQGKLYEKQIDFYTGMIADLKDETKHDKRKQFLDFVVSCSSGSKTGCLPDFESIWNFLENHK